MNKDELGEMIVKTILLDMIRGGKDAKAAPAHRPANKEGQLAAAKTYFETLGKSREFSFGERLKIRDAVLKQAGQTIEDCAELFYIRPIAPPIFTAKDGGGVSVVDCMILHVNDCGCCLKEIGGNSAYVEPYHAEGAEAEQPAATGTPNPSTPWKQPEDDGAGLGGRIFQGADFAA